MPARRSLGKIESKSLPLAHDRHSAAVLVQQRPAVKIDKSADTYSHVRLSSCLLDGRVESLPSVTTCKKFIHFCSSRMVQRLLATTCVPRRTRHRPPEVAEDVGEPSGDPWATR